MANISGQTARREGYKPFQGRFGLRWKPSGDSAIELASMDELAGAARQLGEWWEAVEPGIRRVIFDRPNMPTGESLSGRLQTRVAAICENYSECSANANGCEGRISSDGPITEPMEAGS